MSVNASLRCCRAAVRREGGGRRAGGDGGGGLEKRPAVELGRREGRSRRGERSEKGDLRRRARGGYEARQHLERWCFDGHSKTSLFREHRIGLNCDTPQIV